MFQKNPRHKDRFLMFQTVDENRSFLLNMNKPVRNVDEEDEDFVTSNKKSGE